MAYVIKSDVVITADNEEEKTMENKRVYQMKRLLISIICFFVISIFGIFLKEAKVFASEKILSVCNGDKLNVYVYAGDTGTIVPNQNDGLPVIIGYDEQGSPIYGTDISKQVIKYTYSVEFDADETCITVDENGNYKAVAPGSEVVFITGYNDRNESVFYAKVTFNVELDMTNVTLSQTYVEGYLFPIYCYKDAVYYEDAEFDIAVNSPVILDENMYGVDLECQTSNDNVRANVTLSGNILHLEVNAYEKCTVGVSISIAGKDFQITVSLNPVKISASSLLLEKGHSKKLAISSCPGHITWTSSNNKVATVSEKGVVKGKKLGNVIITAEIGGKKIGCAVSVTSKKLKKVCERASYIGTHWKYSQAKRTKSGYYDCSALVWKAYKQCAGVTFGDASYPGTTVTESAWCKAHKRMIKGGYSYKKVAKMQLNPGDIVFKSTDLKKPYKTTYHVEMFTGYVCLGYDSNGKPNITTLWAARGAGYGAEEGSLLARPIK